MNTDTTEEIVSKDFHDSQVSVLSNEIEFLNTEKMQLKEQLDHYESMIRYLCRKVKVISDEYEHLERLQAHSK